MEEGHANPTATLAVPISESVASVQQVDLTCSS